jgi:hypothetical protein
MEILKVDLKKKLKQYYNPKSIAEIIEIPAMQYLMIDGLGVVESKEFQESIEALFSVSYKTKFTAKKTINFDYTVMPLEGLWWADNMDDFVNGRKENWKWTLMIMQPDEISDKLIHNAIEETSKKKNLGALSQLRFLKYTEGNVAQIMHVGPFSEEHSNIMKIHRLIEENNGKFDGKIQKHHEIYLSDFRKVDQSKMKIILRQPFSL